MSVSVSFITLGCSKNLVDAQVMAGLLKVADVPLAPRPERADILVVNTCGFIHSARKEAVAAILSACEHKRSGGCRAVVVSGCMVQRYRERLIRLFPDVDAFLGIDELERLPKLARRLEEGERGGLWVAPGPARKLYRPPFPTLLFSGGPFAYLKIAEGCDHHCAYCAIPQIRGAYRSRPADEIAREAEALVRAGVRELNLVSQDSLSYGVDRSGRPEIADLVRRLDAIDGDFWIRLLYGYPAGVSDEMLDLLRTSRRVCRYLDLPIQHSHPDMLRAMNRAPALSATQGLAVRLRQAVPGLVLRTTCLVGFPGETESRFEALLETVAASQFDHLGVFVYSPEEGTAAFKRRAPKRDLAEERCRRLLEVQRRIVRARARDLTGALDTALLLRPGRKGVWRARLQRQAPEVDGETRVRGAPPHARIGDFLRVKLCGGRGYDLEAQADDAAAR